LWITGGNHHLRHTLSSFRQATKQGPLSEKNGCRLLAWRALGSGAIHIRHHKPNRVAGAAFAHEGKATAIRLMKRIGLATPANTFLGVPPSTGTWLERSVAGYVVVITGRVIDDVTVI
jgi:hypothetical protein